jgi:hypothetical protein
MEGGEDCIQDWLIRLCMSLSELSMMIEDARGRLRRGTYAEMAITHPFQDIPSGPTDKAIPLDTAWLNTTPSRATPVVCC